MKTIQMMLFALATALLGSGCFINIDDDDSFSIGCLNADGPFVSKSLVLDDFSGIKNKTSVEVFIRQGDEQEVIVEGKEDAIDELEMDVNNGIWEIEFDRCVRDLDNMQIFITLPVLRKVYSSGSGDIMGENLFLAEDIDFQLSGSGDVRIEAEADDIDVKISGSGDLIIDGLCDEAVYRLSGSGDVQAFGMQSRTADINISGSGGTEVNVAEFLKVRISGSGDVRFIGSPEIDVNITGSGDLIDEN